MRILCGVLALCWVTRCTLCGADGATDSAQPPAPARNATRSFRPPKFVNYREPKREYVERAAGGWKVFLESELVDEHAELADAALHRLDTKLGELLRLLPEHSHARLRQLPIYLLLGKEAKAGGRDNGAEYFQHNAPEFHEFLDPHWGSSLVIYSARNYVWLDDDWALRVLIHEFGHAWQLEQWPEKQPDILAAWQNAVDQKLYEGVKDLQGGRIERAYAVTNQLEYFAELSCAYFFRGEYEPFDREALREHDPMGFAMLEKMWGIHGAPPEATRR
jgi:hypothetical protein